MLSLLDSKRIVKQIARIAVILACVFAATSLRKRLRNPNEDLEMFLFVVGVALFLPSLIFGVFGHFVGRWIGGTWWVRQKPDR
jgi:hypothetical protein